LNDKEI